MPGPRFDCMTRMIDFIADDDQYDPGYYDDHGYDGDLGGSDLKRLMCLVAWAE